MTRENKLALVVGFGLLLFVGILVSDHFSAAHRQDKADLAVARQTRERAPGPVSIAPMPAAVATANADVKPEPMATMGGDAVPASRGVVPIASDARASRPTSVVEVAEPTRAPVSASAKGDARRQETEPGVKMRPIGEGESLYSICKQEYGDGSLAEALARYNKSAVPDPKRIRKGVTIRIPPAETLRGGRSPRASAEVARTDVPALAASDVVSVASREPAGASRNIDVIDSPTTAAKSEASPPIVASERTYVVKKGDTLALIAQRELGSKARWKEIA
ncbi:MAG: LysM peptidoglycan-binding domain-containing protein, partial [Planctomycetota bacterium]